MATKGSFLLLGEATSVGALSENRRDRLILILLTLLKDQLVVVLVHLGDVVTKKVAIAH